MSNEVSPERTPATYGEMVEDTPRESTPVLSMYDIKGMKNDLTELAETYGRDLAFYEHAKTGFQSSYQTYRHFETDLPQTFHDIAKKERRLAADKTEKAAIQADPVGYMNKKLAEGAKTNEVEEEMESQISWLTEKILETEGLLNSLRKTPETLARAKEGMIEDVGKLALLEKRNRKTLRKIRKLTKELAKAEKESR